jgi:hypothetical protein
VKTILFLVLAFCGTVYAAQDPVDTLTVCTKDGICTVTVVFHAEDILSDKGNRCDTFKALMKRATEQAKAAAGVQLKAMEDEAKAEEKREKEKAAPKSEPVRKETKKDIKTWELHELPGKWKCAGKDCSKPADVVPIPENAR